MSEDPSYTPIRDTVGPNSYLGYLQTLRAHYFPKPLLIAEVGVPTSWGDAHFAQSGMDHGGQDEIKQGNDDVRLVRKCLRRPDERRRSVRLDRRVVEADLDRRRARASA